MAYLIAAFSWWAILLSKKNNEIYMLKKSIFVNEQVSDLDTIEAEYNKSKNMILGEGLVFAISILLSLIFINRAFWSELKLNKRLNNFLLSVTHELKTPVASLKLINRTLANKDLDLNQRKELLDTSYEESQRLESLINNILTAAQMETSYKLNFEAFDINQLISKRILAFKKINKNRSISFNSNKEAISLKIDKEAFVKIIDNLIDNAIKYSEEDSNIYINTNNINNTTSIEFLDNGLGISTIDKKKVLQKFFRVGNENTRETKGTGLGLFIVKEYTEAHNGKITISDNSPQGSIFKLTFER